MHGSRTWPAVAEEFAGDVDGAVAEIGSARIAALATPMPCPGTSGCQRAMPSA